MGGTESKREEETDGDTEEDTDSITEVSSPDTKLEDAGPQQNRFSNHSDFFCANELVANSLPQL